MKEERLIYLAGKDFSNNLEEEEKSELRDLLKESDAHQSLYNHLKETWDQTGKYKPVIKTDINASWGKFQRVIQETPRKKIFELHPLIKVAAVILIAVGLGWIIINPFSQTEYLTQAGEELEVVLSDESVILLNERSSLVVNKGFGQQDRRVEFTGEAFFDIAENPAKPFVIQARNSQVKVLGTSFNIDAKDELLVEVDVISGRVSLSESGTDNNEIILTKGMSGVFNSASKTLNGSEYANQNFQAWKTRTLEFSDVAMTEVIEDVSEYYGIAFEVDNELIRGCKLTSTFTESSLEEVINVISLTLDLTFEKKEDTYLIKGTGCSEN